MAGWATTSTRKNEACYLVTRSVFAVQLSLDCDSSILIDGELTTAVRGSIDGIRNFAFTSLNRPIQQGIVKKKKIKSK